MLKSKAYGIYAVYILELFVLHSLILFYLGDIIVNKQIVYTQPVYTLD